MNKEAILAMLAQLKPKYAKEGFEIVGLFGSYARGDATSQSDIDLLFDTNETFVQRYRGFHAFSKFEEIRNELETLFQHKVDLVDRQGLIQHKNEYILSKAIYVLAGRSV